MRLLDARRLLISLTISEFNLRDDFEINGQTKHVNNVTQYAYILRVTVATASGHL